MLRRLFYIYYLASNEVMGVMRVEQIFFEHFNDQPDATSMARGRVNLIGEHIDYNGGVVLPTSCAHCNESWRRRCG